MPTTQHHPPSQLANMNGKMFMIDCGEGTQLLMRRANIRIGKLHSIFISHLHGDHIFGLPGLFSTLSLLGRTEDVTLYAHREIETLLEPFLAYMGSHLTFKINRSEEHTSELQSRLNLVCRLLLEKKNTCHAL